MGRATRCTFCSHTKFPFHWAYFPKFAAMVCVSSLPVIWFVEILCTVFMQRELKRKFLNGLDKVHCVQVDMFSDRGREVFAACLNGTSSPSGAATNSDVPFTKPSEPENPERALSSPQQVLKLKRSLSDSAQQSELPSKKPKGGDFASTSKFGIIVGCHLCGGLSHVTSQMYYEGE